MGAGGGAVESSGRESAAARAASRRTVVGVKKFMAERVIGVLKSGLEFELRVEGSRVEKRVTDTNVGCWMRC